MGKVDDPTRLEAVLAALSLADAEWLSRQLEPLGARPGSWSRRGLRPRPAAEASAAELERYLASVWRGQRHLPELPTDALLRYQVLHRVAVATGGELLAWRVV